MEWRNLEDATLELWLMFVLILKGPLEPM